MTVNRRFLSVVGPTHWSYRSEDKAGDLLMPGYWDEAAESGDQPWNPVLSKGDFIFVSGDRWAMLLYVFQAHNRVVVGVMNAVGAVGDLPAIDYPDKEAWA